MNKPELPPDKSGKPGIKESTKRVRKTDDEPYSSVKRAVTRVAKAHEASEGIGAKVRRFVGNRNVRCLPPFVICEQFRMNELGRPPHPARGAQKITYVLGGKVRIEYSPDNTIELGPGDVTSLMVGRGVIRSVKAVSDDDAISKKAHASGIQIFMDVPEPFKRNDPSHLNLSRSDIRDYEMSKGVIVRILTGSLMGQKAEQMLTTTPALIVDCVIQPGAHIDLPVKEDWNAFAYVIDGCARVQGESAIKHAYVEFMRTITESNENRTSETETTNTEGGNDDDDSDDSCNDIITLAVDSDTENESRILFCAAKPLCQPIYRQGPFVDVSMNWIHQAFHDYSERKNGFESGQWWNSHKSRSDAVSRPNVPYAATSASAASTPSAASASPSSSNSPSPTPPTNAPSKASFPNSFPPGSVNPASHSTEFNDKDCVLEQQERKIPKPNSKRRMSESADSDTSDAPSPPPQKKRQL